MLSLMLSSMVGGHASKVIRNPQLTEIFKAPSYKQKEAKVGNEGNEAKHEHQLR